MITLEVGPFDHDDHQFMMAVDWTPDDSTPPGCHDEMYIPALIWDNARITTVNVYPHADEWCVTIDLIALRESVTDDQLDEAVIEAIQKYRESEETSL